MLSVGIATQAASAESLIVCIQLLSVFVYDYLCLYYYFDLYVYRKTNWTFWKICIHINYIYFYVQKGKVWLQKRFWSPVIMYWEKNLYRFLTTPGWLQECWLQFEYVIHIAQTVQKNEAVTNLRLKRSCYWSSWKSALNIVWSPAHCMHRQFVQSGLNLHKLKDLCFTLRLWTQFGFKL